MTNWLYESIHELPAGSRNKVHVWCASRNQPYCRLQKLSLLLSADEQARAERFHFAQERDQCIVARGLLRTLLGGYLRMEPSQLQLINTAQGKPELKGNVNSELLLHFNLSHSKDLILFGFGWGRSIGIDIEYIRPLNGLEQIAVQVLSQRENAQLGALSARQKQRLFYIFWTQKEAYLKAHGEGLSEFLAQIEVLLSTDGEVRLMDRRITVPGATSWRQIMFEPASQYIAALAAEGDDWEVEVHRLI